MKIAALTMVYDESLILPYFLRHYAYLDEIHALYETDSTDSSLAILKQAANVTIENCHIENGLDDLEKANLINETLHGIKAANKISVGHLVVLVIKVLTATILMGIAAYALSALNLAAVIAIFTILYFVLIFVFRVFDKTDTAMVLRIIGK